MAKYSKGLVSRICDDLATGNHTIADVCLRNGINEGTFYRWKKEKSEFSKALKEAELGRLESFKEMAKSGLAKLLDIHEYEEVSTEYETGKDGKPRVKFQKRTKKKIMPNPTAVIFTLTNRDPDNWKNKQSIDAKGDFTHNIGFGDFLINAAGATDEETQEGGDDDVQE